MQLVRLNKAHLIKPFDCGDADLNDFFIYSSKKFQEQLLAVTYILENESETIAFFSLLNDKISVTDAESGNKWGKIIKNFMPEGKRMRSYPSMKIGRLGVNIKHQGKNHGRQILDYLKHLFVNNNRTGCKFITVDAYKDSLSFYEGNGFKYLTTKDVNSDTRLMYFDLIQIPIE